jgi:hypothetical protein
MKCLQDIKFDIIDKIREDLYKGGLFFYGANSNEMIYKGSSPESIQRVAKVLNESYKDSLIHMSENGVITISPSDELAQRYLNAYSQTQTDAENVPFSEEQRERGYEIDNIGPNTESMLSPLGEETLGVFEKFIRHKERLKKFLENRLSAIAKELKNSKTTTERRTELNDLKLKINMRLHGEPHRLIVGLEQEISDLRRNANIDAIGYYVEQDLARLKTLVQSNNANDIKEARTIIDFYDAAGTFQSDRENPFFPQDQMFFFDDGKATPDYKLGEEMMNQFKQWRDVAMGFAPAIDLRAKEVTVNSFNADLGVQKAYNTEFNFDAIVHTIEGLKDVDWVSAWAMDVTQAIFSKAAPLAQVMHSYLVNAMEGHLNYSREYAKAIEELTPKVTKRLAEIEGGKYKLRAFGILGLNGVSYDMFLDTTKNGMQTGTLVQRFTKEFIDAQVEQGNRFSKLFEEARLADDTVKPALYNAAFEANKQWKRANTIMMNPALIEELLNDPEFAPLQNEKSTPAERQAHKKELIDLLGEKGYQEEVDKQKRLLSKFIADRQSYINAQMTFEGVTEEKSLSPNSQFIIKQWDLQHSPMMGVKDYYSSEGIFVDKRKINSYMDYNNTIPRSKKVTITTSKGLFHFEDNDTPTGFYNERFKTIEQDEVLSEFYDLVKQGLDKISESAPYELQKAMPALTLPMLMKSTTEFLIDNRNGTLKMVSSAWRRMWDRIRLSFGLIQQSEISYAVKDPITGKYNYKVNDQFLQGNQRAVKERSLIEKIKFLQAYNIGKTKGRLEKINRFTAVPLSAMNTSTLAHLAQLLNVDISSDEIAAGKIDKIKAVTGEVAPIGRIIRDFSVHNVVQAQSFDLPKLMKHFTNLASAYAARTEALPVMEIMKAHYEQIKNPKTNNTSNPILNMLEGKIASEENRKRANEQMENWFQRVMLDNYGIKHSGVFGGKNKIIKEEEIDTEEEGGEVSTISSTTVTTKIPLIGEKIYSTEEKKKIKEIDELISKEKDEKIIGQLNKIKEGLGKTRTATAAMLNFLDLVRTIRLGWSLSSGVSNFAEGYISNMILASGGEFFNPEEIYYGYAVGRKSWVKNISFGLRAHPDARKARVLMDRYNVLLDSKNELQKATVKTNLSKLESLNPYEINARVEYLNQMPILVAMLRSQKIKDKNGIESSIWEAMDSDGELDEDFRTEENINNWEKLTGNDYLAFKNKMNEGIVRAHGNYDELRGMMLKSSVAGKAIAMFKTWLPMQLFWRFGQEQVNLKTGKKFKGRYRSFTPGSGTVYGAGIGLLAFGLGPMALIPAGIGLTAGHLLGLKTDLGAIKETALTTAMLFKKAIGMPINILTGRNLIKSNNDFNKWIGQGKFTELDARNLRGNMAELSIMMTTLSLMLLVKSFFWDDDDDKESAERQFHNVAVNKLMQLASQATMYVKPTATWKSTFGDIAVLKYLEDVGKEMKNLQQLMLGTDPGGTKTWRQTKKTFIPGLFKDLDLHLGFGSQAEKQFEVSPFDDWFHGEEFLTARKEKQIRKNLNQDLKDAGYEDQKQRLKILNMEMPTTKQLNKKGYSREEWNEELKDWERPIPEVKEEQEQEQ